MTSNLFNVQESSINLKSRLSVVRENPRKMHKSYLMQQGLLSIIEEKTSHVPSNWNMRNRIDYILQDEQTATCHCGKLCKPGGKYCSGGCVGRCPILRVSMSEIQKNNAPERAAKSRKTYMEKYGTTWNNSIPGVIESKRAKRKVKKQEKLESLFTTNGMDWVLFSDPQYLCEIRDECTSLRELSDTHFKGMHRVFIQKYYASLGLDTYKKTGSEGEEDLASWIQSLGYEPLRNDRTIIAPYELDIVIPEHKLAIEYDGIYWHSTKKDAQQNGHKDKTELVEASGYELLHVFESEWAYKPDIIKSIIRNKLGLSKKIHARKTKLVLVSSKEAKEFFARNHLQGTAQASHYIGLKYMDELVMCISIGKSRFDRNFQYELIRMATKLDHVIVGGVSKLMAYVKQNITTELFTYCDRKISSGKTYSQFGTFLGSTSPGYSWHSYNGWLSRYQTQKEKLEKLLPQHYDATKTEVEIMESAGYYKLYDCGNMKFLLA